MTDQSTNSNRPLSFEPATEAAIEEVWTTRWGTPIVTAIDTYLPADVDGLAARDSGGELAGILTWRIDGTCVELITIDAFPEGARTGSRLLAEAERLLREAGVLTAVLATADDNLGAFAFWLHHGFRLVGVELDAMDGVREVKPEVPLLGRDGLPLRDLWRMEKTL